MDAKTKRGLLVSSNWCQAIVIVFLFGFFVLGLLAYWTYTYEPPIPLQVRDPSGNVLFTRDDIRQGQQVFLRNGLMEYGSIFGHGAYLGPDFTADYLHRAALIVLDQYGGGSASDRARAETVVDFKTNRYNASTGTLEYTAAQAMAFKELEAHYRDFFSQPSTPFGLRPKAITDPQQIYDLTAFFSWSAWASAALRPGLEYSYTNNWPSEPLVGNHLTADAIVWTTLFSRIVAPPSTRSITRSPPASALAARRRGPACSGRPPSVGRGEWRFSAPGSPPRASPGSAIRTRGPYTFARHQERA